MSTTHCSGSQWRVVSWCGPSQCAHASGSIVTIKDALATILSWSTYVICIAFCFVLAERLYAHIQYRVCYPLEKTSGEWRFLHDRAARPASIEIYIASRPLDGSAGTASLTSKISISRILVTLIIKHRSHGGRRFSIYAWDEIKWRAN